MADGEKRHELHPTNIAVIREVYDSENAIETFEIELERALEAKCMTIIIEPAKLGDETARWIKVGNILSKTAVTTGVASIAAGVIWQNIPLTYVPLTATSALCAILYTVSWQTDPCVQYQVEKDERKINRILVTSTQLASNSPVILVRKSDRFRRYVHGGVAFVAVAFCSWNVLRG